MTARDLSSEWTGPLRLRGDTDVNRLALVLGPVRTIVSIVDDSSPAMAVDWAQVGTDDRGNPLSMSHTDFRGGRIAVNPLPVLEDKLDPADQIDVCVGQALHEAYHRHSRGRWLATLLRTEGGKEVPAFEPLRIAVWLLNIAEDPRIEGLGNADWPGFAPYIDRLLDWLWDETSKRSELPREVGSTVPDRLKVAFLGARFPDRIDDVGDYADVQAEAAWWAAWRLDYTAGRSTPSEAVQRGLDRLGEDPAVRREMDEMAAQDARDRKMNETLRQALERLIREGVDGAPTGCAAFGDRSLLGEATAERVRELVREGLAEVVPVIPMGAAVPKVRVRKPVENAESRGAYVGRPDPLVEAMRAALAFRASTPRHDEKLRRSGEMDDEELWRLATGDRRVFTERVVESRPDTALGMLVDISGSMLGGGLAKAQRLAQILLAAASDAEGVTPFVWAHTGDSEAGEGADVFTVWEPGDPASRLGLISSLDHGNNYDSYAAQVCVTRLVAMEQEQKVLLVLSDGLPAGHDYGGPEAHAHMRAVCRWAESRGVSVISVAVDGALNAAAQSAMFDKWVSYTNDQQLARDLTRILEGLVR